MQCATGSYLKTGLNTYSFGTKNVGLVIKFNQSGSLLWETALSFTGGMDGFRLTDITADTQGSVYAVGVTSDTFVLTGTKQQHGYAGRSGIFILSCKYDQNGSLLMDKVLTPTVDINAFDDSNVAYVAVDLNKNIYMTGYLGALTVDASTIIGSTDLGTSFINYYDQNGNWLWYKGNNYGLCPLMKTDAANNIYTMAAAIQQSLLKVM